jgi:hypothetical protein
MNEPSVGRRPLDVARNGRADRLQKFVGRLVVESAEMFSKNGHHDLNRHRSSAVQIGVTDSFQRRRILLYAEYLFGAIDRGLDPLDLIIMEFYRLSRSGTEVWDFFLVVAAK